MFVIRQATVEDTPTLLKLAKMVHFINLPPDPDIITTKIVRSRKSFGGQLESERDRIFVFVLEDTETGNLVGTSSIISCISWPGHPHVFLKVRRREHYSEDLQSGQVHVTLQLDTDESGPSELGGLIVGPSYRGHKERLGAQLSLVRFHYMGRHRKWFDDRIVAEMMGAVTPDSRTLLWEYLGRRFINLDYSEADGFSQHSKEFITSLFPHGEIYASLLPAAARNLIGKVGPETEPAKVMLERLGFKECGHVDPFDAGPYLEARLSDVELVTSTKMATLAAPAKKNGGRGFVSYEGELGFRAVRTTLTLNGDEVSIPAAAAKAIGAEPGNEVCVTPLPKPSRDAEPPAVEAKPTQALSRES
jgi:arginine N-succinyltransferase